MNTIDVANPQTRMNVNGQPQFLLLGDTTVINSNPAIQEKIRNKGSDVSINGFWGTLGLPDDRPLDFRGQLRVSRAGNLESVDPSVLEHIRELGAIKSPDSGRVVERFIDFNDIVFRDFQPEVNANAETGWIQDNIPKLRLTIFLGKDEGAIVYYDHGNGDSPDKTIEYILPQEEPVVMRDRLNYIFSIVPSRQIVKENGKLALGNEHDKDFVIKVLVFKRDNSEAVPQKALTEMIHKINNNPETGFGPSIDGENAKYRLLKYSRGSNSFEEVSTTVTVDSGAKTLLLIHGTFVLTANSFAGLMKREERYGNRSWLEKTIDTGDYAQVLAFDHPTVTEDAAQNVAVLFERLQLAGADFSANPVDVITTSRGGLVGKHFICVDPNAALPVRKAALIACANGVGYFTTGAYIGKLLGVFRALNAGNPIATAILAIVQFSVDTFLQLPGCQQMTIGSNRLQNVLNAVPHGVNTNVKFQTIVGDWDRVLTENEKWGKRMLDLGLDLIIQPMLGHENDWVVGTEKQKILPAGYEVAPIQVTSCHTIYLDTSPTIRDVHHLLENFLLQERLP
jgi:hypothetical protein